MNEPLIVQTWKQKRAEMLGQIKAYEAQIAHANLIGGNDAPGFDTLLRKFHTLAFLKEGSRQCRPLR